MFTRLVAAFLFGCERTKNGRCPQKDEATKHENSKTYSVAPPWKLVILMPDSLISFLILAESDGFVKDVFRWDLLG